MANSYFNWPTSLNRFIPLDTARAADVNDAFDEVSAGLDGVEADVGTSIKITTATVSQEITASAGARAGKVITFDGSGNATLSDNTYDSTGANAAAAAASASTATTQAGIATTKAGEADASAIAAAASASAATTHIANTSNPHSVTKAQVGLGNVDNTSNATERAATATLTNKTLTNPTINGFTGDTSAINIGGEQIVKDANGNVGIGVNNSGVYGGAKFATMDGISMVIPGSKLHLYYISSTNRAWVGSETGGEITLGTGLSAPTERMRIATDGTTTFVSAAFGYGVGAGGTVTQATSKGTVVTLNKPSGQITMHNAALASGATVQFSVTDSFAAIKDTISINMVEVHNSTNYQIWASAGTGNFLINVRNISGGSLSEAIVINFNIIKGSTS